MEKTPDETTHAVGAIVWVKITGGKWWPAEVVSQDSCPEEVTRGLRKQPLAIVKFFHEDYYEIVKSNNHLLPFVCSRKSEFIRKGRELLKQDPDNKEKFNKDVAEAEQLCGVPSEDIYDFCNSFGDHGPPSPYSSSHYSFSSFSKSKQNTYGSAMVQTSSSGGGLGSSGEGQPSKAHAGGRRLVQSYGGEGDTTYAHSHHHRRNSADNGSDGGDAATSLGKDVRIRMQPSPAVTPKWAAYSCDVCGFQTGRIANIIVHGRSHSDALRHWVDSGCGARDRPTSTSLAYHSDTTGGSVKHRKKDSNHHSTKVQKLKRKLVESVKQKHSQKKVSGDEAAATATAESDTTSDAPSTPKKRGPKPALNEDGTPVHKKRGPKPALNEDGSPVHKKRGPKPALNEDGTPIHKKRGPKPALNEDGTPVAKKRKKKEDDSDSIFDKIKRQTVRKNNRGRPRGGGASSFPGIIGLGHRRRAGSDGSSDEDEFLISRGVYEEEEELVEDVTSPEVAAVVADDVTAEKAAETEASKADDTVKIAVVETTESQPVEQMEANDKVVPAEKEVCEPMDIDLPAADVLPETSDTSEKISKTEETVVDDKEKSVVDDKEKSVVDDTEKPVVDDTEKPVVDDKEKSIGDDKEKSVVDDKEKPVVDDTEKSVVDDEEKSVVDDKEKPVVDDKEKSVEDDKEKSVAEPTPIDTVDTATEAVDDIKILEETDVVKEKVSDSPRAAHGRDFGSAASTSSLPHETEYLAAQQPEDLTSQPEDLTPQREEGAAAGGSSPLSDDRSPAEIEVPSDDDDNDDDDDEEDDDAPPKAAPKSREDSSSPPEDLTTRAEDLTSRPVDLSTLQEEPSSGALPKDASTLLEVSTSLLEDSATLLQSSATLLQDTVSLLSGGPSSSSSIGGSLLLLPDSTGNSEDWPSRSSTSKLTVNLWPRRSDNDWGAADDACEESPSSPRPDSHVAPQQHPADEVSTSDVLRHLGLVPVAESALSSRSSGLEETSSAPHYGRDTPSSSDALLPAVGTTDRRSSPGTSRRSSLQDPEESTVEQGAADDGGSSSRRVRAGGSSSADDGGGARGDAEQVSQTNDDDLVSQTDDDRISQTDDERVSHAEDDHVSHTDDRISQSDDGTSHYEDNRISQTDNRISQTSYDAQPRSDYQSSYPSSRDAEVSVPQQSVSSIDLREEVVIPDVCAELELSLPDVEPSTATGPAYDFGNEREQVGSAMDLEAASQSVVEQETIVDNAVVVDDDNDVVIGQSVIEEEVTIDHSNIVEQEFNDDVVEEEVVTVDHSNIVDEEVITVDHSSVVEEEVVTLDHSTIVEEEVIVDNSVVVDDEVTIAQSGVSQDVDEEDEVTVGPSVVEEEVTIEQSVVEEECVSQVVEEECVSQVVEEECVSQVVEEECVSQVVEEECVSQVVEEECVSQVVEEECVSQVVECSTALEDCVIVDALTAAHRVAPTTEPHEHWSQHVIDENGLVVAAPPDIYDEDPPHSRSGQGYEGYVYGMEEDSNHQQQMSVTTSSRRDGSDALSAAMESADVPIAMDTEYSGSSMAEHVGLASSDELLASIPMPPPQDDQHYNMPMLPTGEQQQQQHYQPPLPPSDDYPMIPPSSADVTGGAGDTYDDSMEVEVGGQEEHVQHQQLEYTKLETLVQEPSVGGGDVMYMDDACIMEGGAEEVVQVENTEEVIDEMEMFCNEVVIESDDHEQQHQEEYDAICMVQEETVDGGGIVAGATEQSYGVVGSSQIDDVMMMGGGSDVSSKGTTMAIGNDEEVGVNGALNVQGGVGLDNGLSFGHAR